MSNHIASEAIHKLTEARKEIKNRWIPYAVTLRGSLLAGKVERDVLIDELKRLDPANAESIAQKASREADAEYELFKGEKASSNYQAALADSEARRRDK